MAAAAAWAVLLGGFAAAAEPSRGAAPLAAAAQRGEAKEVLRLLSAGADPNACLADGASPLHWAVQRDWEEATRRLLAAGARVSAANHYGVRPLSLACLNGNGVIVELLLAAGADPQTALRGGETALMTAARTGRLPAVRALLEAGARVDACDAQGQTALMWAAAEGHVETVRALGAAGADCRKTLPSGFTPLLFAARGGRTEAVVALIQLGADPRQAIEARPATGKSPRRGASPLMMALENGHFETAGALLAAGADPNDQRSGFAPLHAISWIRSPNRGDGDDGLPPPAGSGRQTSLEAVAELVARGADVNLRLKRGEGGRGRLSRRGATPLLMAADTADVPLLRKLVALGADPSIPNAEGCPPLLAAAGVGTLAPGEEAGTEDEALEAVKYLLELGADINAVDDHGETAMHGAAYKNLPRMVALLAARGADIDVWDRPNQYGWSPLAIAAGHRVGNFKPSPETVAALLRVYRAAGRTPPSIPSRQVPRPGYDP